MNDIKELYDALYKEMDEHIVMTPFVVINAVAALMDSKRADVKSGLQRFKQALYDSQVDVVRDLGNLAAVDVVRDLGNLAAIVDQFELGGEL